MSKSLNVSVSSMNLSARLLNRLREGFLDPRGWMFPNRRPVHQIGDLIGFTQRDLSCIQGMGKLSVQELVQKLWDAGYRKTPPCDDPDDVLIDHSGPFAGSFCNRKPRLCL